MLKHGMMISDYLSNFDDSDFSKSILAYIRIKECAQFKEEIARNSFAQNMLIDSRHNTDIEMDLVHLNETYFNDTNNFGMYEDNSFSGANGKVNQGISDTEVSSNLWENVMDVLNYCKENNRMKDLLKNYNKILKLHIDHKIFIDPQCFRVFLYSTKPSYIEHIFNNNLIHDSDLKHLECIFKKELLFIGLDIFGTSDTISSLNSMICSLTILLYKTRCQRFFKSIVSNLNNKLAVFVNKEHPCLKKSKFWDDFKNKSIKHLLKAVYLNGIFEKDSMNQFLNNKEIRSYSDSTESDSDDWPSDDEEMVGVDINNNPIRDRSIVPKLSVGERIKSLSNTKEINKMFPLSMKCLARLSIKKSMPNYSSKNVNKLKMLPRDLRKFVLFQNEIDAAMKSLL